jgi:4-hydroxythreonine-4-phosphate dehydrogenase
LSPVTRHASPLIVTAGEPAGIGPDLCVRLAHDPPDIPLVILANRELIAQRGGQLGLSFAIPDYAPGKALPLSLLSLPLGAPVVPGQLDRANAGYVLDGLRRAVAGCQSGEFAGLVTGPVHKGVINDAGHAFTGHTEYLAALTGAPRVVMMLAGAMRHGAGMLRVALATDRKSTRLNSSHNPASRMPSSA